MLINITIYLRKCLGAACDNQKYNDSVDHEENTFVTQAEADIAQCRFSITSGRNRNLRTAFSINSSTLV